MTDGNPPENKQDSGRPPGGRNNRVAASNFDDGQTLEGTVREIFPRSIFKVELDNGTEILAHISGKSSKNDQSYFGGAEAPSPNLTTYYLEPFQRKFFVKTNDFLARPS
jgi:hypothetical protein